jgi:hypothetical protein
VQKCTEIANVSRYASLLFVFKLQSQFACKANYLASPVMSISAAENAFCLSVRAAAGDDMFASVWIWLSWQPETL